MDYFTSRMLQLSTPGTATPQGQWLKVRLTGRAQTAFQRLPEVNKGSYSLSKEAQQERFDPKSRRELYAVELNTRRKRKAEGWADLAEDVHLRRLADKAFPVLQEEARECLALNQYLSQISDHQVAFGVRQSRPKFLDAAVTCTLELETYASTSRMTEPERIAHVGSKEETSTMVVAVQTPSNDAVLTLLHDLTEQVERLEGISSKRAEEASLAIVWRKCGQEGHYARGCASRWRVALGKCQNLSSRRKTSATLATTETSSGAASLEPGAARPTAISGAAMAAVGTSSHGATTPFLMPTLAPRTDVLTHNMDSTPEVLPSNPTSTPPPNTTNKVSAATLTVANQSSPAELQLTQNTGPIFTQGTSTNAARDATPAIAGTSPDPLSTPKFTWGTFSGPEMANAITKTYDEIIHWRHNLFLVPSGNTGNSFVLELARLLQVFADGFSMESVCMKAITILQVLVLQKPSHTSKSRDHTKHLKRRMDIWKAGNLEKILLEGKCIQEHLPKPSKRRDKSKLAKSFQRLVSRGKIKKALRLLSNSSSGVLGLDDMVPDQADGSPQRITREVLIEKHRPWKPAPPNNLLQGHPGNANPILFENLNAEAIRKAAMKTNGAAGLSGLDAYAWRRLCSSFKSASKDLCTALAAVERRLCTDNINPDHLSAFVACRLIPLNKCPGVRPIGIGEVPRRIIAKAILGLLKQDILDASGPLQVCAGQESGCEAANHAMRQIFADMDTDGALLIDATNAFNSINRQVSSSQH